MSKALRNFLIIAAILLIIGGIIAAVGTLLGGMRSITLTREGIVINEIGNGRLVEVSEKYNKVTEVRIRADLGDFILEEGDYFALKGRYNASILKLDVSEKSGVLTIECRSINKTIFGWNLGSLDGEDNRLTLTYPRGTKFTNVDVTLNLGGLHISNFEADSLIASLDAGSLFGNSITVGRLDAKMNLGDCKVDDLTILKTAVFNLDAGSFKGKSITAENLEARISLGSCTIDDLTVSKGAEFRLSAGSLYLRNASVYNLQASNNLGGIDYWGVLKGNAEFTLDAGALKLNLDNAETDLSYRIKTDLGSVSINGRSQGSSVNSSVVSPECTLEINTSLGSVAVTTR